MGDPSSVGKLVSPSVDMRIRITAEEFIKPHYPTPYRLRNFELSLLDQFLPPWLYARLLLFYPATTSSVQASEKVRSLKNSLSHTLVLFYPLAGKIKDATTIECNDTGAVFIEARIDTGLSRLMSKPDTDLLRWFVPICDPDTMGKFANCALLVQVTIFDCGGLALAVCPTHKLMDGASIYTFVKAWAKLTTLHDNNGMGNTVSPLHFLGPIIPPVKDLPDHHLSPHPIDSEKFSSRRFVFSGSNLKSLKAKCGSIDSSGHRPPSRVEVVQALIVKCVTRSRLHPGPSLVFQTLNLRSRINPPVSGDAVGNLVWSPPCFVEEGVTELQQIVAALRRGAKKFQDEKLGRFNPDEGFGVVSEELKERPELIRRAGGNVYSFSSACGIPLYEIDFGWSRPAWISFLHSVFPNLYRLADTRTGDGVEAWMTLEKEVMASLERDEEFLAYASIDPPVDINLAKPKFPFIRSNI